MQPGQPSADPTALDPKGAEYEFGPQEDQIIGTLASRMRRVGLMQIIASGLQFAGYTGGFILLDSKHKVLELGTELPVALAFLVGGFLVLGAGGAFRSIVDTRGNDVGHLMRAFDKLSLLMTILASAFVVATALFLVSFVLRLLGK